MEGNNEKDCDNCKYYQSFADAYFDDMEPEYVGFCKNDDSPHFKVFCKDSCNFFEEGVYGK